MAQRISSYIAIIRGVGQFADAHTIEHNPEDSRVGIHAALVDPFDETLPQQDSS
jgi:hypothetical protein